MGTFEKIKLSHVTIQMHADHHSNIVIMQVQNFGGPPPKNMGTKNMQNFGRFYATSEFL